MPAPFVTKQIYLPIKLAGVSGTIWEGSASLGDSHSVVWETSGKASLRQMAVVVNWRITGPGTDLMGRASLPLPLRRDRAALDAVRGRVEWPLVEVLLPDLSIRCDVSAELKNLQLFLVKGTREWAGTISTPPGVCEGIDGTVPAVPTPALTAILTTDAAGLVATVKQSAPPRSALFTVGLTNDDLINLTVHPAGVVLVPGKASTSESEIELPLSALFP